MATYYEQLKPIQKEIGTTPDGYWGENTLKAVCSREEMRPSTLKQVQAILGVVQDGIIGPNTINALQSKLDIKDVNTDDGSKDMSDWKKLKVSTKNNFIDKSTVPSQAEVLSQKSIFGEPGWPKNATKVKVPWKMYYGGSLYPTITFNGLAAENLRNALEEIYYFYGDEGITDIGLDKFAGCFVEKNVKGTNTTSMHAWALAIDFDPNRNGEYTKSEDARLSRVDVEPVWDIFNKYGFSSLGRNSGRDWMHVQYGYFKNDSDEK